MMQSEWLAIMAGGSIVFIHEFHSIVYVLVGSMALTTACELHGTMNELYYLNP